MKYKAIFSLFLLATTLAIVHAKPSPVWIYLMSNQEAEEAANEKQIIESDKEVTADTEDALLPELSQKIKRVYTYTLQLPVMSVGGDLDFAMDHNGVCT